jgi:hypothetical protein
MPRRKVSTGDGKRKADAAAAATQAPAKKTCPHRTPQTPFESGDKETTYIVDKMVGTRWNQGSREYLVRWKGHAASADTWEPMENLVGCAQQIREYEKLRGKEDIEAKAAVLAKRQEAKNAAAVVEADLKARAAEAALAGAGDGNASAAHSADTTGSVHKAHAMKKGLIWSAYDKTGENQSCLLVKGGGWQTSVGDAICGCVPSDKAGTFDKGRGIVGYFNSSVVGYNEEGVGLHACQKSSGVTENKLTQDVKTRWRTVGACACTCSLGLAPCACAYTCGLGLGLARLVRGLHGKCGTPPSTSGCSGVKGQIRGVSLPGAACSSNEYRPTRVVGGKRDQLPSVERYGAAVPWCPGHLSLS